MRARICLIQRGFWELIFACAGPGFYSEHQEGVKIFKLRANRGRHFARVFLNGSSLCPG
jgi:hypothetical protein